MNLPMRLRLAVIDVVYGVRTARSGVATSSATPD